MTALLHLQGRWKGAIVAIKVIDHRLKGNDMGMDIQRESMLSTSIVHPNVVSCGPAHLHPGQPALPSCNCARQVLLACGKNASQHVCVCPPAWQLLATGTYARRCQQAASAGKVLRPSLHDLTAGNCSPRPPALPGRAWKMGPESCPVLRQASLRVPLCGCPPTSMITALQLWLPPN